MRRSAYNRQPEEHITNEDADASHEDGSHLTVQVTQRELASSASQYRYGERTWSAGIGAGMENNDVELHTLMASVSMSAPPTPRMCRASMERNT